MVPGKASGLEGIVVAIKANYILVNIHGQQVEKSSQFIHQDKEVKLLLCTRRNRLVHHGITINVGDKVSLESVDWINRKAVVSDVLPRETLLLRPPVANVTDVIILLSVVEPEFNFDQANRFLLTAEQSTLNVSLVLTKRDLIKSIELKNQLDRLQNWGYQPHSVSIKNGYGIPAFLEHLRSCKIAVFCGPSGVGKSSLLNYLLPNNSLAVGELSGRLKRGRHTTRHVELFSLGNGTLVADSPGFNRPELNIKPSGLATLFPEMRNQIKGNSCKFRNCLHRDEPGCVVSKDWERYLYYRQCLDEIISSPH